MDQAPKTQWQMAEEDQRRDQISIVIRCLFAYDRSPVG